MSIALIALAFFLVAARGAAALLFPVFNRLVAFRPALARGSVLVATLPLIAGATLALAAVIPGDPHLGHLLTCHCATSMPGWLHLCPVHPTTAPGLIVPALAAVALLGPGWLRALVALAREPRGHGGAAQPTIVDLPRPAAALHGWLRPSLVVDRSLWKQLTRIQREAVLAHERGHLARRDPLVLMVLRVLTTAGPRSAAQQLLRGWLDHAEQRADAAAAAELGDPVIIADALVRCARAGTRPAALGLAWTGGRLEQRVRALLEPGSHGQPARPDVGGADLLLLALLGLGALAATPWLHHRVEHLLNLSF